MVVKHSIKNHNGKFNYNVYDNGQLVLIKSGDLGSKRMLQGKIEDDIQVSVVHLPPPNMLYMKPQSDIPHPH